MAPDDDMIAAAKAAIDIENTKTGKNLELVKVVSGSKQVVAGVLYKMVLSVKHVNSPAIYGQKYVRVTVWSRAWMNPPYNLNSFVDTAIPAAASGGGSF